MSFMKEILNRNIPIWDECAATPFVQELQAGTLPLDKFYGYMIQDSIYLKHYARIYGKAIYHSATLKDIQFYYSALGFVTDTESAIRLNYLKQLGITDNDIEFIKPLPENQSYIEFILEVAAQGSVCEMLMAILPCMLSYSYIFRKISSASEISGSRYRDFIRDYGDEQYFESCKQWSDFADEKCKVLSGKEQGKLSCIFEKASLLELGFWKMAYGGQNV